MAFYKLSLGTLTRIRRAYCRKLFPLSMPCHALLSSRHFASEPTQKYYCAKLSERSLIRIAGPDSFDFLQGLITNDVRHLQNYNSTAVSRRCIYAFMLNTSGRILVDTFVYNFSQLKDELLLEVDSHALSQVMALLKRYKIRRKLTIDHVKENSVSVIYPELPEQVSSTNASQTLPSNEFVVQDPRHHCFGYRVICPEAQTGLITNVIAKDFKDVSVESSQPEHYRTFRYRHGIGEGVVDFPPESVLPLEANGEILNGVSFQKGCYVGQELTARSYHVGVIRKRLLPIKLLPVDTQQSDWSQSLPVQNIVKEDGKIMGKFRVNFHENGLAVLRFADLIGKAEPPPLKLLESELTIRTWRPFWWPDSILS